MPLEQPKTRYESQGRCESGRLTMKSFSVEGEFYKNVYDIFFECYFMDDFCNRVMSMCTRFIEWRHSFLLLIKEAVRLRMIKKACLRQQIGMQSFFPQSYPLPVWTGDFLSYLRAPHSEQYW